jgi:hypothetical protein
MNKTKITGSQLYEESYANKKPKSSKSVQIGMVTVRTTHLAINNPGQQVFQIQSSILVVSSYMLIVFRPSCEVVKEGRILSLVSGYRRFVVSI